MTPLTFATKWRTIGPPMVFFNWDLCKTVIKLLGWTSPGIEAGLHDTLDPKCPERHVVPPAALNRVCNHDDIDHTNC